MKLKTQLMLAMALTAVICTLAISITANYELQMHFKAYLTQVQSEHGMMGFEPVYNDFDRHFVKTLNRVFWIMGSAVMLFGIGLGAFLAAKIHKPIDTAIKATVDLSKGRQPSPVKLSRGTAQELVNLQRAVEALGETLAVQEKLRKQLTADVAHELRTPLASLQSHIELMMEGIWEPSKARLGSCYEEVERLTRLINDLNQLAKYDDAASHLNLQAIDMVLLCDQVKQIMAPSFEKQGIAFILSVAPVWVTLDADKMTQVLINLLQNALSHTVAGSVTLTVTAEQDWVNCTVSDTGSGMPEAVLPHIFERFYRVDPSRNRLTGGSGIGLSIVKAIIDAHRGDVMVTSQLGKGSTFTVKLRR